MGVLKNPEYQELMGRVLENTVFNLLQEASHGEFNLTTMPKKYMVLEAEDDADSDEGEMAKN